MIAKLRPACGGCCTKLRHFSVSVPGKTILEEIDLHIHCGELTAVIGPNGGGKTTLLKAILGELPFSGQLSFVHESNQQFGRPRIGYVPQVMAGFVGIPVTVHDLFASSEQNLPIWMHRSARLKRQVEERLDLVGAMHLLQRPVSQLSVGELQRVLLAFALNPYPHLLLLDEPTSGLDHEGTRQFYRIIKELPSKLDLSILLVSHDLAALSEVADRVIVLNTKVLKDGRPVDVLTDPIVAQLFGGMIADPRLLPKDSSSAKQPHDVCEHP